MIKVHANYKMEELNHFPKWSLVDVVVVVESLKAKMNFDGLIDSEKEKLHLINHLLKLNLFDCENDQKQWILSLEIDDGDVQKKEIRHLFCQRIKKLHFLIYRKKEKRNKF